MNQVILNGIKLEEFWEQLEQLIDKKLNKTEEKKGGQVPSGHLSREEVCTLLKITLPTLSEWTKQGILQSYKIGSRVLYKANEIESAINKSSTNKHRRGL